MKKMFFAGLLVFASAQASAGLIDSVTYDYGNSMFDSGGAADTLIVSDWSSERFLDVFNFSGIGGTVSELALLRNVGGAGSSTSCFWFMCGSTESWGGRVQTSISSETGEDLLINITTTLTPQSLALSSVTDIGPVDAVSVPEPGSMALLGLGFVGITFVRRRRAGSNLAI
jgi:hypothetical protein